MSKIYNELYSRVQYMVNLFSIAEDDFDDTVQLVMMKIFEKGLALTPISSKLLYVITRNTVVDSSRRRARLHRYLDRGVYLDSMGTVCDSTANGLELYVPEDERQNRESELDAIIDCESLKPLSVSHQEILDFRLQGLTCKQIAHHLEICVGTVKSRLHYARKRNRANRH